MKITIRQCILGFILITGLYSCTKHKSDAPDPGQEKMTEKKMKIVVTTKGDQDTHQWSVMLYALKRVGDTTLFPLMTPLIDNRDGEKYEKVVIKSSQIDTSSAITAHSQGKIPGISVVFTISPNDEPIDGDMIIEVKTYADNKLVDDSQFKSSKEIYQKSYRVLANGKKTKD
ncbi:MAG TPA: hypothetical protein VK084_05085 [Chitinophagaceae bacterium]|nr:hypothetical protein [Chitinophagaceae bacterium]